MLKFFIILIFGKLVAAAPSEELTEIQDSIKSGLAYNFEGVNDEIATESFCLSAENCQFYQHCRNLKCQLDEGLVSCLIITFMVVTIIVMSCCCCQRKKKYIIVNK